MLGPGDTEVSKKRTDVNYKTTVQQAAKAAAELLLGHWAQDPAVSTMTGSEISGVFFKIYVHIFA